MWLLAVLVALAVGTSVHRAERVRREWGPTSDVVVARRALAAGELVHAHDVELRRWPVGLVPDSALTEVPDGRRLTTSVQVGEVLVSSRIARSGAGVTSARVPEGSAAATLPLGPAPPPLSVGDRVDVLAPAPGQDPWSGDAHPDGVEVVASAAEVIELRDGHATVVLSRSEVDRTAAAILGGTLTVVLTG